MRAPTRLLNQAGCTSIVLVLVLCSLVGLRRHAYEGVHGDKGFQGPSAVFVHPTFTSAPLTAEGSLGPGLPAPARLGPQLAAPAPQPAEAAPQPAELPGALASRAAAVYGAVEKQGPVDLRRWHAASGAWRERHFLRWRQRAAVAGASGRPPPPLPGCQVFHSRGYGFIYLRTAKAASSTVLVHFGLCDGSLGPAQPWCLAPIDPGLSPPEVESLWRASYVFGFTRSPLSRALSTYRFLMQKVVDGPPCGDVGLNWDGFCQDPAITARLCRELPECCPLGENFMHVHLSNQVTCLQTRADDRGRRPGQHWAADYLGRVEHWAEDFGAVIAAINERRNASLPAVPSPEPGARQNGGPCRAGDRRRRQQRRRALGEGEGEGVASGGSSDTPLPSDGGGGGGGPAGPSDPAQPGHGCPQEIQWAGKLLRWNGSGEAEGYGANKDAFWAPPHLHCLMGVQQYYRADMEALGFRRTGPG